MDNFFHLIKPTIWANMRENKPPTSRSFSRIRFRQNEQTQSESLRNKENLKSFFPLWLFYLHGNDFVLLIQWAWTKRAGGGASKMRGAKRFCFFRKSCFFWWIKTSVSLISFTCERIYPSESEDERMLSIQLFRWF